jgi:hypothetical protein
MTGRPRVDDRSPEVKPVSTVTLKAPVQWMNYAPSRGKRYSSNAEGLIENVHPDDVRPLVNAGCVPVD